MAKAVKYMSIKELAELSKISERTFQRHCASGKVEYRTISGNGGVRYEILISSLDKKLQDIIFLNSVSGSNNTHTIPNIYASAAGFSLTVCSNPLTKSSNLLCVQEESTFCTLTEEQEAALSFFGLDKIAEQTRIAPEEEKKKALAKVDLIYAFKEFRSDAKTSGKTNADKHFAELYKKVRFDFVKTSIASKFFNIAQVCQLNSEIGLCTGASGLGKTTAIRNYAKTHAGVIVIDPDENITMRTLLRLLGSALRLKMSNNMSCQEFTEKLVDRLKDSDYLIIIDEAENIDSSCFRTLRKIHDRCDFTCGLLFVGTERLAANLARMQGEFSYVTNRLGYIENLDSLLPEDAEKLIRQVFPECTQELYELFYKLCKSNTRHLFNLVKRTYDILISSKQELNDRMIKTAYKKITI